MKQPCSTPTHLYPLPALTHFLHTRNPPSHTPPNPLTHPNQSTTTIQNEEDEFVERIRRQNRLKEEVDLNILNYDRNVPDIKKAQGSWLRAKREHALVAEKQVNILSLFNPCSSVYFPCCILSSKPL